MDFIYVTAFRITADEDDARDIVQETFLKVWEKRGILKKGSSVISYIRKIAVNKCYDLLRRRKFRFADTRIDDGFLINEINADDRADDELNNEEAASILRSLASGLSPRQRIVFTMIELEELSHDEVAEIIGMNKSSIKSNLSHARKEMERKVKEYFKMKKL